MLGENVIYVAQSENRSSTATAKTKPQQWHARAKTPLPLLVSFLPPQACSPGSVSSLFSSRLSKHSHRRAAPLRAPPVPYRLVLVDALVGRRCGTRSSGDSRLACVVCVWLGVRRCKCNAGRTRKRISVQVSGIKRSRRCWCVFAGDGGLVVSMESRWCG
jgi:hypothetical protein